MPAKKSPLESATCHLAEARRRWCALAADDSVSPKHARSMKAALKSLDKAIEKLALSVSGPVKRQSGGFAPLEPLPPGQLDRGTIITNSSGLTVDSHNPVGAATMDRINSPRHMPQPFSTNDDPTLHLPTSGLDPSIKTTIVPNIGGYANNYGTTQIPTIVGGGKKKKCPKKRA